MQRAAIYSRKSKFTGKGESVENQVEMCRQYINLHLTDVDKDNIVVYEDVYKRQIWKGMKRRGKC